jgi:hypothetical protein
MWALRFALAKLNTCLQQKKNPLRGFKKGLTRRIVRPFGLYSLKQY